MLSFLIFVVIVAAAFTLAIFQLPIWGWALSAFVASFVWIMFSGFGFISALFLLAGLILAALSVTEIRRRFFAKPAFAALSKMMPEVSATEREALEGGTVGWDGELFSGRPDFEKLRAISPIRLSNEEQAFLDGPTHKLCEMIDDWHIRREAQEIPEDIWQFVKQQGFLGMLISKQHGGLGFSAQAQSLILGKISSCSPDVAVIVMVPNSLGPGELIEKYGTDQQKEHFLPRLASGKEVPCFGLTGPTSGSDAATMRDIGEITKGEHGGEEVLGIKLNFQKRYITLAPNASLVGLAFQLFDPQKLLSDDDALGITVALLPADHEGVVIGNRHLPAGCAFPNGPVEGRDVFIPLEWVIGGREGVGQGWRMLMSCLAAGRAISLPASGTAGCKSMLRTTSAYARLRRQFGIPIAKMEGIEEPLARLVEAAYITESGRALTASMVSSGEKPAVLSALLKYQSTEWIRRANNDAMDIHGGRGICDGPSNYLQAAYQSIPVGITVEGANILTRTLITFAQGALRSHPFLYKEIQAIEIEDKQQGFEAFEPLLYGHIKFSVANFFAALFHNLSFGVFAHAPSQAGDLSRWYKWVSRASCNFALVSDITIALLGGGMKKKQKITGRLADSLSELYYMSAMLKRYEDDGQPREQREILEYAMQNALYRMQQVMAELTHNFPVPFVGFVLRRILFPFGNRSRRASDQLGKAIVQKVITPGEVRDQLTRHIYISNEVDDAMGILEVALQEAIKIEPVEKKLEKAIRDGKLNRYHGNDWIEEAARLDILSQSEASDYRYYNELLTKVIAVDQFDPALLKRVNIITENENIAAE